MELLIIIANRFDSGMLYKDEKILIPVSNDNLIINLILLFILAGCVQQQNTSNAHGQDDILHLFNWNNYIGQKTINRFEQECQCQVSQDYFSDNEEMLGSVDVLR